MGSAEISIRTSPHLGPRQAYGGAALYVKFARWIPVVHGVKSSDLVDAHRRHLQNSCNLVHDADAGKAMLALTQIQQRHHRCLLVLARIAAQHLLDELFILRIEFERNIEVVLGRVAVLLAVLEKQDSGVAMHAYHVETGTLCNG